MFISLCIIAYNEEKTLPDILCDLVRQEYSHDNIEVLLVDSNSTDGTKRLMQDFARQNNEWQGTGRHFRRVVILDNPGKTLPRGWNVALREYRGEAILKVDAHASVPPDFISKNVEVLESGEDICGGQRPNIIDEATPWKQTLLLAESSMFGSSIASYRRKPARGYVKSIFHAAYRRRVFEKTGFFNERLDRTEDNEMHYRMRKAGFRICFDPEIISYQHTRSSLRKMLRQKYANGYWVALTTGECPQCLSLFHFVPFAFVLAILITSALCMINAAAGVTGLMAAIVSGVTALMWLTYWILAVIMAVLTTATAGENNNPDCFLLPLLFFALHISYGIGSLVGFIRLPFWKKHQKRTERT